jgi:ubiquitin-protein ligase E3 C
MFSTFTGSSRRPRNVNLSGQASNPFSNTSWSPSAASNATKTVSDAQADREKRQVERRRLKAASQIQKTWRGYRSRSTLKEKRRNDFDLVYQSLSNADAFQRLYVSFPLLLSFFSAAHAGDLQRLFLFINDCNNVSLQQLCEASHHTSRLQKLTVVLVQALDVLVTKEYVYCCSHAEDQAVGSSKLLAPHNVTHKLTRLYSDTPLELQHILTLINHLAVNFPLIILASVYEYYAALAKLCQSQRGQEWPEIVVRSLSAPLNTGAENGMQS